MSAQPLESDPEVRRFGITREQFDRMVGPDGYDSPPVELLEGVLVEVVPQGGEHNDVVGELGQMLAQAVRPPWRVRTHSPFAAGVRSQPEPDVAVVLRRPGAHPDTAALIVEVAQSSQRLDLVHKPRVYAAAGVPVYWVVDLPAREVVVHSDLVDGGYASVERAPWTASLEVTIGDEALTVVLEELLADGE
ncbi:Putative restriction endonuclease [Quadrisphaera granulorum]|uniref:Putative restriction endonuclease n=1 Tax=Quadrisphaera granulorum TaxID=317664 RepID=A0A316A732_9ACTN|nr:Uma2 family endonuclease [Quadrisphaera granulorum]PWJ53525.1 putative restriction endonuclease [Quadrisphaera granulorum]SZE96867.1 Putative restriction endonuclease [Quadrisphaera granulorum]